MSRLHALLSHHESGHYRAMPSYVTTRPRPTDHLIIWVVRGEMDATIGGTPAGAGPGDLLVLEPVVPQRYKPLDGGDGDGDGDWEWLWVHFGGAGARELSERIRHGTGPVVPFGFDEHIRARFLELVATAARSGNLPDLAVAQPAANGPGLPGGSGGSGGPGGRGGGSGGRGGGSGGRGGGSGGSGGWGGGPGGLAGDSLRVDSCLYSLLGLIADRAASVAAGRAPSAAAAMPDVHEFINDRLGEPLTLRDLVAHTGYSATHLSRLFREQLGESPMHYVHRLRMARAASLLTVSTLSVAEIARAVGFPDPYHFSRRFKQTTGYAPAHYRAINKAAYG
ncbi:MAG TPA: helix-turn-helix transcriptional regulator [Candidatus Limnocylindrales bacterium]